MPSYGSLQQAVKVRPGKGEKEQREREKKLFGLVELFLPQRFALYLRNETGETNPQNAQKSGSASTELE